MTSTKPGIKAILPYFLVALTALAIVWLYHGLLPGMNSTTIALSYLLVVLVSASYAGLGPAIFASILGIFCFNYFFLPPIGTLTIHDPDNWVALIAFLITAVIASELSASARKRALEAERHREEERNLYQLSRAIIVTPDPKVAVTSIARNVLEIFRLKYCAVFMKESDGALSRLSVAEETDGQIQFQPSSDRIIETLDNPGVWEASIATVKEPVYVPLKFGMKTMGAMVFGSSQLDRTMLEAIAALVALALERARFLEELGQTEALQKSDELKSALLAAVSHDLRTPLTTLRAAIDSLMQEDIETNPEALKELHQIVREDVERLTRLVENLLEMARIEAGELHLSKQWESISDMFQIAIDRSANLLDQHQLQVEIEEPFPLVKIDSRLLVQAITNLIENAAKYSPKGSKITLSSKLEADHLLVRVEDHGPGIPPEESSRIFDKFYRLRQPNSKISGTGMGLAIARGIVQAHGGKIWVESVSGIGSVFVLKIPVEHKDQILSV